MHRIEIGKVVLYPQWRRVEVDGLKIKLSSKQWEFIHALALCSGTLVTRKYLLASLYPDPADQPGPRVLDMLACYVRKRLAAVLDGANYVHAVSSHGYILREAA